MKSFGSSVTLWRPLETGEAYVTPERAEYRIDRRLTEYYEWRIGRLPLPDGRHGVVCYFRDISAQVRARAAIAESEQRFRQVADTMPQIVWTARPDGYIDYYNERWYEFTGFPRGEFGQSSWEGILHADDVQRTLDTYFGCIRAGKPYQIEYRFKNRATGGYRWFMGRALPVKNAQGEIVRWFGTCTDIDDLKRAQEQLAAAQAQLADRAGQLEQAVAERTAELSTTNKQLEAFVYSIAHDLRAPLRAMQGFSVMLMDEAGAVLSETGKDYAERINKSAQFMDDMLSDLLAFSRISQQRLELTSVNLGMVVESVLSRLQKEIQEKNARVESSGSWPDVLAHEPALAQVLYNLTSNALKFVAPDVPPQVRLWTEEISETAEVGRVSPLRAAAGSHDQDGAHGVTRPTLRSGRWVRVCVEDNGIGIAPEYQDQIFRLFTRLHGEKYEGTGLGLAIVQKGVERMGGRVAVESAFGQGSRFWFELRKP